MIDVAFPIEDMYVKSVGEVNKEDILKSIINSPIYINGSIAGTITEVNEGDGVVIGVLISTPVATSIDSFINQVDLDIRERIDIEIQGDETQE